MAQYRMRIPLDGDVFTEEALAGMLGKDVRLTEPDLDGKRPVGHATIVAAEQRPDGLYVTIEPRLSAEGSRRWGHALGHVTDDAYPALLGFTIRSAAADEDGHRTFRSIVPMVLSPRTDIDPAKIVRKDR